MENLFDGTDYQLTDFVHGVNGWGQLLGADPRRVALAVTARTQFWLWPRQPSTVDGIGYASTLGAALQLNGYWHGPVVSGEWWIWATIAAPIYVLETVLKSGSIYNANTPQPGGKQCYKFSGGKWEELVNGAFNRPGDDTEPRAGSDFQPDA